MPEALLGLGVSSGVAVGRVLLLEAAAMPVAAVGVDLAEIEQEVERFRAARARVREELEELKRRVFAVLGDRYAGMIDAHLLILDDPGLVEETERRIRSESVSARWALKQAAEGFFRRFDAVDEAYFKERGGDLADVHRRVQRVLAGQAVHAGSAHEGPVVVVAHSLGPADAAALARHGVVGLATDLGGRTSHTAILAQALSVPAVVGLHDISRRVRPGELIVVDADQGRIELRPDAQTLAEGWERQRAWHERETTLASASVLPSVTRDGVEVVLRANVEFPEEVDLALRLGARGIGLYRSEFLFLSRRPERPTEEDHYLTYRELVGRVSPYPAVIRTFDFGGDKDMEEPLQRALRRPILGLRGVRFCLQRPDIFRPQVRALLRAAAHGDLRVLLPLVTQVGEIREVRRILSEEAEALRSLGVIHRTGLPVGIMVEVPAAAMAADLLAREADFFSIGTNDLVQYAVAVDRDDDSTALLERSTHTGVLRMVRFVVECAAARRIPVSLCGEMAADPSLTPLLLGLGLREFSVQARSVALLRDAVRAVHAGDAVASVRALLEGHGTQSGQDARLAP